MKPRPVKVPRPPRPQGPRIVKPPVDLEGVIELPMPAQVVESGWQ